MRIWDPYLGPRETFPPDPPDFWTEEIRRLTDAEGVRWVLVRDQDGEEFLVDEYDHDHPEDRL